MAEGFSRASVVVTHGGPASFIEAMAVDKVPVVVPRQSLFNEHVNNHQVEFVRLIAERQGGMVPCYDVADLSSAIDEARRLSACGGGFASRNAEFCREFAQLIKGL